ncbi:MAG: GNAT family N-acetyltransferase [Lentisphaerae bacterium]|nr:GNAT family N-acetyltransferase [Lentisphaerota bacterium]
MDLQKAQQAYFRKRSENMNAMREHLKKFSRQDQFLGHVFWDNAALDSQGVLQTFCGSLPEKGHFNAISFEPATPTPEVERVGRFSRLQVSVHRILDLSSFHEKDDYFRQLSQKNRKKLRWLSNAVPALGCRIAALETEDDFAMFEQLYTAQFPKYTMGCEADRALWTIYRELIRQGKSFSFILLSPENKPLAAALGYLEGNSYNYTHLTRYSGEYDKYSPGYFLTYSIILKLIQEHPEVDFFFMGPGDYDYKRALGGKPMAIYRYLKRSLSSLPGLIRMYFRAGKQRKNFSYLQ